MNAPIEVHLHLSCQISPDSNETPPRLDARSHPPLHNNGGCNGHTWHTKVHRRIQFVGHPRDTAVQREG